MKVILKNGKTIRVSLMEANELSKMIINLDKGDDPSLIYARIFNKNTNDVIKLFNIGDISAIA